ncbi:MAG: dTMP kinase [Bacteroidales bacterium]|nr:dTMP kinase [Bacteroidales bacterium]MBS3774783.1 dTMP kinase [Bacteroidales bacterium]
MNFINIEGLDASGKSTQIQLLRQYFQEHNIPCKYLHFPRTESPVFGKLIAMFLRGELGEINSVNPYLVALIYAGDRNDAKTTIQKWMEENYLVLVDRYVYSNIAFQGAKLENDKEIEALTDWIKYLEYEYHQIPRPDINLYLDVPAEFTKVQLKAKRRGTDREYLQGKEDIHEKDLGFQESVREIYLREISKEEDFKLIDCRDQSGKMLDSTHIRDKILQRLKL